MAAYILASYDITDPQAYQRYVEGVVPLLKKHGAEILVADREPQPLEGATSRYYVVLKFASREAALAWYDDPAYAPVRKIRLDCSKDGSMVLTKGFGR